MTYPGGEIVRYEYYKNGWLKNVIDNEGQVTSYTYDSLGNMLTCTRPNNTKEIRTYNKAGQLISQREETIHTDGSKEEVLSNYTYSYDEKGNIITVDGFETQESASGIGNLKSASFEYDAENRLIKYNGKDVLYDQSGNMVYGPLDGEMCVFTYDCRNRLISAGGVNYTYDAENQRIASETDDTRIEYTIDTVSTELSKVLEETTYIKSKGRETKRIYIYGYGLISEKEGSKTYYHHYNNLGSTMKLTDESGKVIASYSYGTYGELLSGDTTYTRYLYNGSFGVSTDSNGLYYMRQRYYNTEIKRFVNQDILTGSITNALSLNRYSYVQGNPVSYVDPFGLSPVSGKDIAHFVAHGVFAVLGSIPGLTGFVFNSLDCALYISEGNITQAIFAGVCAASFGTAAVAVRFGTVGINIARGALYVARATDLINNSLNFICGTVSINEQFRAIQEKSYSGEVRARDVEILALTMFTTTLSGIGAGLSLKGLRNVEGELSSLVSKYGRVAEKVQNPFSETMTGGVNKTPDAAYQTSYGKSSGNFTERGIFSNKREQMVNSSSAELWGVLDDGTNQGVKHFADYWEKYPERIPSLAERLGVDVSQFENSVDGFKNFTEQALNVKNNGILREVNGKQIYYQEGVANSNKGVVILKNGKIQSMMPSKFKDFIKLQ